MISASQQLSEKMLEQNNLLNVGETLIQGIVDKCRETMELIASMGTRAADEKNYVLNLSKIVR